MVPAVSVIMNCRNGEEYVRQALDSVCAQTFRDWEIVFLDNMSTDGSAAIVRGYGPCVRYFRSGRSMRLGEARNAAIDRARGEFIAFLDTDDVWLPEKLEKQLPLFERRDVGLVYADCYYMDAKGRRFGRFFAKRRPHRGAVLGPLLRGDFIPLPTVVLRKTLLTECGGFDPELSIVEEYELFLRLARRCEVDYVQQAVACYRVHALNATHDFRSHYRETTEVYQRCVAGGLAGHPAIGAELRQAMVTILWKWAGRELFQGRGVREAFRRFGEGIQAAGSLAWVARCVLALVADVLRAGRPRAVRWLRAAESPAPVVAASSRRER